jgi:3-oxoacyl-[acyl-carrier protein] reductase
MQDKVIFITGAGSGIGRACALAFTALSARVAIAGRTLAKCEAVAREAGPDAFAVSCDTRRSAAVRTALAATVERFGGLDVIVHSAGISPAGRVTDISEAEWDECIAADLTSGFLLAKHGIPHLIARGGGAILNVAGTFGMRAATGKAAYAAAKAGLINLSRAIALDYARENVRCNAICPGYVDTPLNAGFDIIARDAFLERYQPLRGLVSAEEVAAMAVYLASDAARMITGQVFAIDAGQQAGLFVP